MHKKPATTTSLAYHPNQTNHDPKLGFRAKNRSIDAKGARSYRHAHSEESVNTACIRSATIVSGKNPLYDQKGVVAIAVVF